ncbi:MAG: acyl--CoA ligase [Patulibacter sp.]|nr:acyl--CoA ligase [Patulibacter sp.]
MLVPSWLLRAADRRPDHEALVTRDGGLSYRELVTVVDAAAGELWRAGARPGSEVGLVLPPGREFVVTLHAILRIGAIAVPVDPLLPAEERERRLTGAVVTVDPEGVAVPRADRAANADCSAVGGAGAGTPHTSPDPTRDEPVVLRDTHDLDAPAIVVHTSGTSGAAKPIPLTYGNWLCSAIGSAATLGCPPDERWLCAMPLHHVGGLSVLLRSVIAGTTAVVHEGWDTERVLAELTGVGDGRGAEGGQGSAKLPPTMVSLVPTTFRRLLDAGLRGPGPAPDGSVPAATAGGATASALRWVLLGGAAIPAGLLEDAATAGIPVAPTYGMTEATSQIATLGPPLFCTTVRIDGPAGPTDDPDVVGEILVSGPTVASVAVGPDGWLRTGDLGRLDARGRLTVVGRTADTIISGGENVLPLEVERVLDRVDGVRESAVFGRPDAEWGERVCARVIVDDPGAFDVGALRDAIRPLLAPHQRPREIELVDELPRTPSGKLLRRALR